MKNVIITGATGAIGMALIDELRNNDVNIYAICRSDSKRIERIRSIEKVTVIECSLADLSKLSELIEESCDVFYHFAWENTFGAAARNDTSSQIRNIQYAVEAVKVAKKLGCKKFVGAGSQAEFGRSNMPLSEKTPPFPENGYGIAKLCAGQMSKIEAENQGIDHVWTRILSVYGPYDSCKTFVMSAIEKMLKGEIFSCTSCEQVWDYMYSKDIARAFYLIGISGSHGSVYTLGGGKATPLKDYLEIIRDTIDPTLTIGFGNLEYSDNQVMRIEADLTLLKNDTGFEPTTDFVDGIKQLVSWIKENQNEQ